MGMFQKLLQDGSQGNECVVTPEIDVSSAYKQCQNRMGDRYTRGKIPTPWPDGPGAGCGRSGSAVHAGLFNGE